MLNSSARGVSGYVFQGYHGCTSRVEQLAWEGLTAMVFHRRKLSDFGSLIFLRSADDSINVGPFLRGPESMKFPYGRKKLGQSSSTRETKSARWLAPEIVDEASFRPRIRTLLL